MAITVQDLMGKNTEIEAKKFPTFEEFKARNNAKTNYVQNNGNYYDPQEHMYSSANTQTISYTQELNKYKTPQQNEFIGNYDRFDENMNYIKHDQYQDAAANLSELKPTNLYDYCRKDYDRLSENQLMAKLSYSTDTPKSNIVFEDAAVAPAKNRFQVRRATKEDSKQVEKTHSRLSTKGKIILGVYVAVVLVSAILIIVNAKKINHGENLVPSASTEDFSISQGIDD